MMRVHIIFLFLLVSSLAVAQTAPYKNAALPVEERVKDLLSRMTPEEKAWQLFMIPGDLDNVKPGQYQNGIFGLQVSAGSQGTDAAQQLLKYNTTENALALVRKINAIQKHFVENTRLGIPIIAFDEALHGLVREGATSFPQAIALAATFDTTLMRRVSTAIAIESQARGIRQILSPVVNVATDVRWGRTEETYGEDPFLVSEMGVAFVQSFEKMNIITTPKHFIANVGEGGRDSYPIHFNERLLEEIHFPPFKACFTRGGSRSVMTSYNSLDGVACSMNEWLLTKTLKQEWNFSGFVISDASAVGGATVLHNTAVDYPTSGDQSISSGLDVIFQTQYEHFDLFGMSSLAKRIPQDKIDEAVSRVLTAKFELGLFEQPYVSETLAEELSKSNQHKILAREAALKSIVLLKNEKNVLPLNQNINTIAVIGTDAVEARLGGYSGKGNGVVSILEGIKQRAGNRNVIYAEGCGRETNEYSVVASQFLKTVKGENGLTGEYFNNVTLSDKPAFVRTDKSIDFHWTLYSPDKSINNGFYSVKWTGKISSPKSGDYKIGLEGNDGYRLYIDNKLIVDKWNKQSYSTVLGSFQFEKDRPYTIVIEFNEPVGNAHLKLVWSVDVENDWKTKIEEAVQAARKSDVAIVAVGIEEGEFRDRAFLTLPGHQEEMIKAIADTGRPVVVVLVGGSAVVMNKWINEVQGILDVWYPGEEGGNAVAQVLFGRYNPAGRLPITFPQAEAQLPLVYNHRPTGRGDDYNNLSGLPLFPFGFGLSYSTFKYEESKLEISKGGDVFGTLRFKITNTGTVAGEEVAQLYIKDRLATVARPVMELKGFQRLQLQPGEAKEVSFTITKEMLQMLNANLEWVVEPGEFELMIGASSRDIRLKEILTVTKP